VPPVRNCLDVVSDTITLFRASPKRSGILQSIMQQDGGRAEHLKSLCETRWVERHEALLTFCEVISPIGEASEMIANGDKGSGETAKKANQFLGLLSAW
jgi:hypothetical protein